MAARTAKLGTNGVNETKKERRLVMVRLESDADELTTHDLFLETENTETARRRAMVEQLKERVAAGTYQPNVILIAERILGDRRR